jgi:hypothetical protein
MKRGSKKIKKNEKSRNGILSYEIIDNTQNMMNSSNSFSNSSFENTKEPKEIINEPFNQVPLVTEQKSSTGRKNPVKALVILIILILLVDVVFLFAYVKPDLKTKLSNFFKPRVVDTPNSSKCSDGTPYNSCSKDRPYYCYNGELLKSAYNCGCPAGYKIAFQDCKKI